MRFLSHLSRLVDTGCTNSDEPDTRHGVRPARNLHEAGGLGKAQSPIASQPSGPGVSGGSVESSPAPATQTHQPSKLRVLWRDRWWLCTSCRRCSDLSP